MAVSLCLLIVCPWSAVRRSPIEFDRESDRAYESLRARGIRMNETTLFEAVVDPLTQ